MTHKRNASMNSGGETQATGVLMWPATLEPKDVATLRCDKRMNLVGPQTF